MEASGRTTVAAVALGVTRPEVEATGLVTAEATDPMIATAFGRGTPLMVAEATDPTDLEATGRAMVRVIAQVVVVQGDRLGLVRGLMIAGVRAGRLDHMEVEVDHHDRMIVGPLVVGVIAQVIAVQGDHLGLVRGRMTAGAGRLGPTIAGVGRPDLTIAGVEADRLVHTIVARGLTQVGHVLIRDHIPVARGRALVPIPADAQIVVRVA